MKKTDGHTIQEWISSLMLEEKIALVAGHNFMSTNAVPRLGIQAIKMSDGPHGLRVQPDDGINDVTHSLPATCFPTASCSANAWSPELLRLMGEAMAEEAKYYGIDVILGPGVNIKRNPLCGRNFEYFSEDPFLAGRLGAAEVVGIQEKGIGVSLKHFALNSSENYRFMGNSVVDMRAAREIYLRQFEYIVKNAKPATLMAAYNKIQGTHCSENRWLLHDVLRKEWGFEGLVMSDWGTTHDRVEGIRAGLDLEMPGDNTISRKWIFDAVKDGTLKESELDVAVRNVLNLVAQHQEKVPSGEVDWDAHNDLAKRIALEGAVLLQNDGSLPLAEQEKLLVVGELFTASRYQGAGSSLIKPYFYCSSREAFDRSGVSYRYVRGYDVNKYEADQALIQEAIEESKAYDKIVLFLGLTDDYECEGMDRSGMAIPKNQLALVDALAKEHKKLIVVLFGGSAMELPFFDQTNAILNMFLSGQNSGEAVADLLFGKANPSGKLAETWPLRYEDVPFANEYSKVAQDVYKESIYVGYRYYLTAEKPVRFPFGFGLSYTNFKYSNLSVDQKDDYLHIVLDVTNIGEKAGKEIVQLYVGAPQQNVHRPLRELKGFAKVDLVPGETKTVAIPVDVEDLRYWDIDANRFVLEEGEYEIQIGRSCSDIALRKRVQIHGEKVMKKLQKPYESLDFAAFGDAEYEAVWGMKIPVLPAKKPITLESRLSDLKASFLGKILYGALQSVPKKQRKKALKLPEGPERENQIKSAGFVSKILDSNSIISLSMSSSGAFPYNFACGFRDLANGHLIRGIHDFIKKIKAPALPVEKEDEHHG